MFKFLFYTSFLCLFTLHVRAQSQRGDVLLVTSSELADSWKPFIEWKTKIGKNVSLVTISHIAQTYQGVDIQEKIRICVRENIDNGTKWVILGGDSLPGDRGVVPDRDTVHINAWGQFYDIPTDIYYISPTNWDTDKDGIYGEIIDDSSDITYPDGTIGLGRIPVRSKEDVIAYTKKVISYESNYPKGDFTNNMIYACSVEQAQPKLRRSWDDHISKVFRNGQVIRHFINRKTELGDPAEVPSLTPENWVNMINSKQAGKLHLHGHGFLHCWQLENYKEFTADHVNLLTNKDAYPIITTVSCFTGHFDAATDPSISESMLRAPDSGAIAVVAPCRSGKPHFINPAQDFELMITEGKLDGTTEAMTLFWEKGIGENLTTGEAIMKTKAILAKKASYSVLFHMCLIELNLLGDPTLPVHYR